MSEMPDGPEACTDEQAIYLPYIMVELPLPCGHPMRVFWRAEAPDDLELHHGEQDECRTFIYDASDMVIRAQMLAGHEDVQKWLRSVCERGSAGDVAQSA